MLIVFGQVAFDNALSVLFTFPDIFKDPPALPSPLLLVKALLVPAAEYSEARIVGLQEAVIRLKRKSRSFYLASSTFQGQIRTDLLLLYSFCRVADDLVDNASSPAEACRWIRKLQQFLAITYGDEKSESSDMDGLLNGFPSDTHSALLQLPTRKLSRQPLEDLLRGFETDLLFTKEKITSPIKSSSDLELYACRVAGTVAQMCIELILHSYPDSVPRKHQQRVLEAGNRMGVALQYVNIARDISVDAHMGRVYLPSTWLEQANLAYESVLKDPQGPKVESLRSRLLDEAFILYEGARDAIEELPTEASGPIRVAVQSYMEIGRVLRQEGYIVKAGRATVPKWRRIMVAWAALAGRI
jgi:15-cis-phytoene synthase/lycopene beta-cyclase